MLLESCDISRNETITQVVLNAIPIGGNLLTKIRIMNVKRASHYVTRKL